MIIADKFETNSKVCVTELFKQSINCFLFIFYQVYVCRLICNKISENYYISKAITRNIFIHKSFLRQVFECFRAFNKHGESHDISNRIFAIETIRDLNESN